MKNQGWLLLTVVALMVLLFVGKNDYGLAGAAAQDKTVAAVKAKIEEPKAVPLTASGKAILNHQAAALARAKPTADAQSRFRFKTEDSVVTVSIFQSGILFTLEDDVLIVENSSGEITATIGTAPGGILLIQQGDMTITCADFVRLTQAGTNVLHVSVTGDGRPLAGQISRASQRGGQGIAGLVSPTLDPTGPAPTPNPEIKKPTTTLPEKVKIVD